MPRGGGIGRGEESKLVSRGRPREPRSGPVRERHENNSPEGRGAGAALGAARLKEIRGLRRDGRGAAAGRLRRRAGAGRPVGKGDLGSGHGALGVSRGRPGTAWEEFFWSWGLGVRR